LPTVETMFHALRGGLGDAPEVIYRTVTSVHIESVEALPYQIDGDVAGNLPLDITISPEALHVIVPAT
jgi:diacylglycerol kinase family enzyme